MEADISWNREECAKNQEYMKFLDWLIREFRPRLAPEGGLKPLGIEAVRALREAAQKRAGVGEAKDGVFMTEQQQNSPSNNLGYPRGGDMIDSGSETGEAFRLQDHIPISHTDVHRFVQEISQDNLFLINLNNEEQEAKDRLIADTSESSDGLLRQIQQT